MYDEFVKALVTVPAIVSTVNWLKQSFDLSGRMCQLVAVIIGVIFALLQALVYNNGYYPLPYLISVIIYGFFYGMAAAGVYDLKNIKWNK